MGIFKKYNDYLKDNPKGYWFKRKLYGWGWTPARWQGWVVTLMFVVLVVWSAVRIDTASHSASDTLIAFAPQLVIFIIIYLLIVWRTGESPRWQWGFPKDDKENMQ